MLMIWMSKVSKGKFHLVSWHAKFGLLTYILIMSIGALKGIRESNLLLISLELYFPNSSLIPWIRSTHSKAGYASLALLLLTPIIHFGITSGIGIYIIVK
jgi:cytochrome b561